MKGTVLKIMLVVAVFFLGWFASDIIANVNAEIPMSINRASGLELASPQDWIKEDQIHVYSDRIIIDLKDAEWATFTDTNSMDPIIDKGSNAIEIIPKSENDIEVGDIVSYKSEYADGTIIHRVIEKGKDENGVYFILKGDNNSANDPGKVRFDQIKRVLVGILY